LSSFYRYLNKDIFPYLFEILHNTSKGYFESVKNTLMKYLYNNYNNNYNNNNNNNNKKKKKKKNKKKK